MERSDAPLTVLRLVVAVKHVADRAGAVA